MSVVTGAAGVAPDSIVVELGLELRGRSANEQRVLKIAQAAAEHLLETFNDDDSLHRAEGLCIDGRPLVRLSIEAMDEDEALDLAQAAAEHLLQTFNDDGSLGEVQVRVGASTEGSKAGEEVRIVRTTVEVEVAAKSVEVSEIALGIKARLSSFVDGRALAGESGAALGRVECRTEVVSPAAAALDEDEVAIFLSSPLESGSMRLEDVPRLMARYALSDPAQMREEFAERMGLDEDVSVDGRNPMTPRG